MSSNSPCYVPQSYEKLHSGKKIRQKFKNLGCTKNQTNQNKHWTIRRQDNCSVDPASHEDWWISYKWWQKVHVIGLYHPSFSCQCSLWTPPYIAQFLSWTQKWCISRAYYIFLFTTTLCIGLFSKWGQSPSAVVSAELLKQRAKLSHTQLWQYCSLLFCLLFGSEHNWNSKTLF